MTDEAPSRGGWSGVLALAALVAASALGGWFYLSQRGPSTVETDGFDMGAAPVSRRAVPAAAPEAAPRSGLELMKVDSELRAETERPPRAEEKPAPPAPAPARTLKESRSEFIAEVRRNEDVVRRYAERMTARSAVIRQYGKDWMSHPDLKKLNDDYMRNHDPIAFVQGLAQAPSFPALLKQYAGRQEIQGFIVQGLTKEAPRSLVTAGLNLMHDDVSLKPIIAQVGTAVGLPPDMAAALAARDAKPADSPAK